MFGKDDCEVFPGPISDLVRSFSMPVVFGSKLKSRINLTYDTAFYL